MPGLTEGILYEDETRDELEKAYNEQSNPLEKVYKPKLTPPDTEGATPVNASEALEAAGRGALTSVAFGAEGLIGGKEFVERGEELASEYPLSYYGGMTAATIASILAGGVGTIGLAEKGATAGGKVAGRVLAKLPVFETIFNTVRETPTLLKVASRVGETGRGVFAFSALGALQHRNPAAAIDYALTDLAMRGAIFGAKTTGKVGFTVMGKIAKAFGLAKSKLKNLYLFAKNPKLARATYEAEKEVEKGTESVNPVLRKKISDIQTQYEAPRLNMAKYLTKQIKAVGNRISKTAKNLQRAASTQFEKSMKNVDKSILLDMEPVYKHVKEVLDEASLINAEGQLVKGWEQRVADLDLEPYVEAYNLLTRKNGVATIGEIYELLRRLGKRGKYSKPKPGSPLVGAVREVRSRIREAVRDNKHLSAVEFSRLLDKYAKAMDALDSMSETFGVNLRQKELTPEVFSKALKAVSEKGKASSAKVMKFVDLESNLQETADLINEAIDDPATKEALLSELTYSFGHYKYLNNLYTTIDKFPEKASKLIEEAYSDSGLKQLTTDMLAAIELFKNSNDPNLKEAALQLENIIGQTNELKIVKEAINLARGGSEGGGSIYYRQMLMRPSGNIVFTTGSSKSFGDKLAEKYLQDKSVLAEFLVRVNKLFEAAGHEEGLFANPAFKAIWHSAYKVTPRPTEYTIQRLAKLMNQPSEKTTRLLDYYQNSIEEALGIGTKTQTEPTGREARTPAEDTYSSPSFNLSY